MTSGFYAIIWKGSLWFSLSFFSLLLCFREKEQERDHTILFILHYSICKGKKQVKEELDQCKQILHRAQVKQNSVSEQMDMQVARLKREQAELSLLDKVFQDRAVYSEGPRHLALRLCEVREQPEVSVSLRELPTVQRYTVSKYEIRNREQLEQTITQLNETLRLAREQKEEA